MQIRPGNYQIISQVGNHTRLNNATPSNDFSIDEPIEDSLGIHRIKTEHPDQDPLPMEDVQLMQAFEMKVPSQGRYLCPNEQPNHTEPSTCLDICLPGDWEEEVNEYGL